jgi:hypothetical protein
LKNFNESVTFNTLKEIGMRKYLASLFFLGLTASVVFGGGGKVDTLGVGQPAPTFYLKSLTGDEIWLRAFANPAKEKFRSSRKFMTNSPPRV